jgi:hypothetical protein
MSSHEAHYGDSSPEDAGPFGTTATWSDRDVEREDLESKDDEREDLEDKDDERGDLESKDDEREDDETDVGGPVLLPVDAPESTSDDEPDTAADNAPVTVVESTVVESGDPTIGPDTETGAQKDPVPDGAFTSDDASAVAVATGSASGSSDSVAGTDDDWHELQSRFVDDPESAVREAGAKVEKALSDLRAKIEGGDTEDLRTAFRRYRDLHAGLS